MVCTSRLLSAWIQRSQRAHTLLDSSVLALETSSYQSKAYDVMYINHIDMHAAPLSIYQLLTVLYSNTYGIKLLIHYC